MRNTLSIHENSLIFEGDFDEPEDIENIKNQFDQLIENNRFEIKIDVTQALFMNSSTVRILLKCIMETKNNIRVSLVYNSEIHWQKISINIFDSFGKPNFKTVDIYTSQ